METSFKDLLYRLHKIPGWMGDAELEYLYNMVKDAPPDALIVEIGAWRGKSTAALYSGLHSEQTVCTVDTWLGQPNLRHGSHKDVLECDIFREFLSYMKAEGFTPIWYSPGRKGHCYLRMHSLDATSLFEPDSIHRFFVDADYSGIDKDLDLWAPLVKPDGILCAHGWNRPNFKDKVEKRLVVTELIGELCVSTDFR